MLKNKLTSFLVSGILAHALFLAAGYVFVGLQVSLLLSFIWACVWLVYCSCKDAPLQADADAATLSDQDRPTLSLALAGGPWCWLLSPSCLIPGSYSKACPPGVGWNFATRLLRAFCRSLLKLMDFIYDYCAERVFAAEKEASTPDDTGSAS